jgi:hypothetical protein
MDASVPCAEKQLNTVGKVANVFGVARPSTIGKRIAENVMYVEALGKMPILGRVAYVQSVEKLPLKNIP